MANYANLLATIAANIYTNGNNEVTAAMVKTAVDQMVASLGAGYQFMGIATPATTPGNTDIKQFYIASEPGTYTDFGGIVVDGGEVVILKGSGTSWSKEVTGAATAQALKQLREQTYGVEYTGTTNGSNVTITGGPIPGGSKITRFEGATAFWLRDGNTSADNIVYLTQAKLPYTLPRAATIIYSTTSGEDVKIYVGGEIYEDAKKITQLSDATIGKRYSFTSVAGNVTLNIPNGEVVTDFSGADDGDLILRSGPNSSDNVFIIRRDRLPYTLPTNITYCYCYVAGQDVTIYTGGLKEGIDLAWKRQWFGKTFVVYGDSITQEGGNTEVSNTDSFMYWAKEKHGFISGLSRGIGGQSYKWNEFGWYNIVGNGGIYTNRYLAVDGEIKAANGTISAENYTAQQKSDIEAVLGDEIEIHYGSFCSWDRITTMIPSARRNEIDVVFLVGGTNDFTALTDLDATPIWIPSDTTDPTWAAADEYNGGDYDISTLPGAIASTAMKMKVWCPNAVIVIVTPFPQFNKTTYQQAKNPSDITFRQLAELEIAVAGNVSAAVIDANGKTGIDGTTFDDHTIDTIHPNLAGREKYGRVIVGELVAIYPEV